MSDNIKEIPLIPNGTEEHLNNRQLEDYKHHRWEWLTWCLTRDKEPETGAGSSQSTMDVRHYRANSFYEWVWDERGYTTNLTHEDADKYMREIALSEYASSSKAHIQKAVKSIYWWREHKFDEQEWEPDLKFTRNGGGASARDYLSKDERQRLREASLKYGSIPNYNSCSRVERDRYKGHLARRFDVHKDYIGLEHWECANGWKIPSLVSVSLDTGLRPVEVQRATADWADLDAGVLRISARTRRKGTPRGRLYSASVPWRYSGAGLSSGRRYRCTIIRMPCG